MDTSIFDSDLNHNELDKLIAQKPELIVLKYIGEIEVEVDGSIEDEDNRFDAPYQEGWVTGGQIDKVTTDDFSVIWSPTESDLKHIEDNIDDLNPEILNNFRKLIMSEPRKTLRYDLTSIINEDKLEKLRNEYLEDNQ